MNEVVNIGPYNNNYQLYEVKDNNAKHGKNRYVEKTTYVVANKDADKFEKYYKEDNRLFNELKKETDTPECHKKLSRKFKFGMALGAVIGAGIPLAVFAAVKNKYARIACAICSVIGGIVGWFYGFIFTSMFSLPKNYKKDVYKNLNEYKKLDYKIIKKEQHKIE